MALRRRVEAAPSDAGRVPAQLYWGMLPDSFDTRPPELIKRTGETGTEARRRWLASVRSFGWTAESLHAAARGDARFQKWLAFRERMRRLCEVDR